MRQASQTKGTIGVRLAGRKGGSGKVFRRDGDRRATDLDHQPPPRPLGCWPERKHTCLQQAPTGNPLRYGPNLSHSLGFGGDWHARASRNPSSLPCGLAPLQKKGGPVSRAAPQPNHLEPKQKQKDELRRYSGRSGAAAQPRAALEIAPGQPGDEERPDLPTGPPSPEPTTMKHRSAPYSRPPT